MAALDKSSRLAPISCSATLGNKTKHKTLVCQSIVLSRTRQRNKRSHQRRKQGRRALLTKRSKALPNPRSVPGNSKFELNCSGKIVSRAGEAAAVEFVAHPHPLCRGAGDKLASDRSDTRSLQAYLGHANIRHTVD